MVKLQISTCYKTHFDCQGIIYTYTQTHTHTHYNKQLDRNNNNRSKAKHCLMITNKSHTIDTVKSYTKAAALKQTTCKQTDELTDKQTLLQA